MGNCRSCVFGWIATAALLIGVGSYASGAFLDARRARILEQERSRLYSEAVPSQPAPPNAISALREEVRRATDRARELRVGSHAVERIVLQCDRVVPNRGDRLLRGDRPLRSRAVVVQGEPQRLDAVMDGHDP